MQINEKIKEINALLPYGSYSVIAKECGLTPHRIRDFFNSDKLPKMETIRKVMPVAQKIADEVKEIIKK